MPSLVPSSKEYGRKAVQQYMEKQGISKGNIVIKIPSRNHHNHIRSNQPCKIPLFYKLKISSTNKGRTYDNK
ncbi:hypothetical protein [Bacillus sp. 1NLA3E]|uniref:hypothetical protein n=1 Tax=Bacillus sp. 1NLA3E TaxID=666686 RepID=UPI0005A259EE|nr:hypothetical protein [Bacillus sp. 1NLA3E]